MAVRLLHSHTYGLSLCPRTFMPIAATLHLGTAYGASIVTQTALTLTLTLTIPVTLILTCLKHSMGQGGRDIRVRRKHNGAIVGSP